MKLPAQAAKPLLEIVGADVELARQPEKREVVTVPADRENLRALRAEVRVDRRAAAAVTADLKCGCGLRGHDIQVPGFHVPEFKVRTANVELWNLELWNLSYAPNELPQPHVDFAFGLLKTNPLLMRFVS